MSKETAAELVERLKANLEGLRESLRQLRESGEKLKKLQDSYLTERQNEQHSNNVISIKSKKKGK